MSLRKISLNHRLRMTFAALAAGMLFASLNAFSQSDSPLADDHPNEYTVQVGDTLWDIAAKFLKLLRNDTGGSMNIILKLWMLMEIMPPSRNFGVKLGKAVADRHDGLLNAKTRMRLQCGECKGLTRGLYSP